MNICYICHEYPPLLNGGIGTFTKELAEGLARRGHNITVLGFYEHGEDNFEGVYLNGVRLLFIKRSKLFPIIFDRIRLRLLFKAINEKYHFDIVETPDFLGWGACIPKGKYIRITRLHGSSTYFSRELGIKRLMYYCWMFIERSALLSADRIISVSHYTAHKTKAIFNLKSEPYVIHNAVVISNANNMRYNDDCRRFIFAGSLLKKKGVIELAKAWCKFASVCQNSTLTFVGKDPENNWPLIKEITSSCANTIEYIGAIPKDKLIEMYHGYDCAIFPSHAEAFALAPMEAMDVGIPIIYSMLTSGTELLTDGIHGFLVNPKDYKNILNKIILLSKLDKKSREAVAISAREHIKENFNFDLFLDKNVKYYEQVLVGKKT